MNHFSLFPKTLAQTVQKFGVEQFRLAFTGGRWKPSSWGSPVIDGPSGVQLTTSFLPSVEGADQWKGLTHSLAGMFCASLSVLKETDRVNPFYSYLDLLDSNPLLEQEAKRVKELSGRDDLIKDLHDTLRNRGAPVTHTAWLAEAKLAGNEKKIAHNKERMVHYKTTKPTSRLFYGEMPEEAVCTENLTPWSKLLPGRAESGLGKLLHSISILSSLYHSIGVHFRYRLPSHCSMNNLAGCERVTMELVQTLTVVFKTEIYREYHIASLFNQPYLSACPLAKGKSFVVVDIPQQVKESLHLLPESSLRQDNVEKYILSVSEPLQILFNDTNALQRRMSRFIL